LWCDSHNFISLVQKKAKKEQKLQQWVKDKEDRAHSEMRLVEEEKKAMKDAGE
jgi:hypothetical protein